MIKNNKLKLIINYLILINNKMIIKILTIKKIRF